MSDRWMQQDGTTAVHDLLAASCQDEAAEQPRPGTGRLPSAEAGCHHQETGLHVGVAAKSTLPTVMAISDEEQQQKAQQQQRLQVLSSTTLPGAGCSGGSAGRAEGCAHLEKGIDAAEAAAGQQQQPPASDEIDGSAATSGGFFKPPRVCSVCGDRAQGFNFNAVTCQSCKAFFRRTAAKNVEVKCAMSGDCHLDVNTRRFCSACRLRKCYSAGMKRELILGEEEKAHRKEKVRRNREQKLRALQESSAAATAEGALVVIPGAMAEALLQPGGLSSVACGGRQQQPTVDKLLLALDGVSTRPIGPVDRTNDGHARASVIASITGDDSGCSAVSSSAGAWLSTRPVLAGLPDHDGCHHALAAPTQAAIGLPRHASAALGSSHVPLYCAEAEAGTGSSTVTCPIAMEHSVMACCGVQTGDSKEDEEGNEATGAATKTATAAAQLCTGGCCADAAATVCYHCSSRGRRSVCVVRPFSSPSSAALTLSTSSTQPAANTVYGRLPSPLLQPNLRRGLTDSQQAELSMLKGAYTRMFCLSSGDGGFATTEMFQHSGRNFFAKRAKFVLRGLLGFASQLQGFSIVPREVQASLLKSAGINCMLLRSVELFDIDADRWDDGHGTVFRLPDLSKTFEGVDVDLRQLVMLARTFKQLLPVANRSGRGSSSSTADNLILFSLLQSIMLLSPEHAIGDDSRDTFADVSDAQQHYLTLLRHHLESTYSFACAADILPVIMQRLNTYKCLAHQARQLLSSLVQLEPLLRGVV